MPLKPHHLLFIAALLGQSPTMQSAEDRLPDLSAKHLSHLDLSRRDLRGVDLSGKTLTAIDFKYSDLRGANFDDTKLDVTNLRGADMRGVVGFGRHTASTELDAEGADFSNTNLRSAKLKATYNGANFRGARFDGADLRDALLDGQFDGASFEGARVEGALIVSAMGLNKSTRRQLRTRGALLTGSDIVEAATTGRSFAEAVLDKLDLTGGNFSNRDMKEVSLHGATLDNTRFNNTGMDGAQLTEAEGRHTSFVGARLPRARLSSSTWRHAVFDKAQLASARFSWSRLSDTSMRGADLSAGEFRSGSLDNVDLSGSTLRGASFREAHLRNVNFSNARLDGIDWAGAILIDPHGIDEAQLDEIRWAARFGGLKITVDAGFRSYGRNVAPGALLVSWALGLAVFILSFRRPPAVRGSYKAMWAISNVALWLLLGFGLLLRLADAGVSAAYALWFGAGAASVLAAVVIGGFAIRTIRHSKRDGLGESGFAFTCAVVHVFVAAHWAVVFMSDAPVF